VPGFNQVPNELAGRGDFFAALGEALEEAAYDARTPRPLILTGARGVGKTVLLTEAHRVAADELGWVGVHHELVVDYPFTAQLAASLAETARLYREERPERAKRAVITSAAVSGGGFGVQAGLQVTRAPEHQAPATLGRCLDDAAAAAMEKSAGLILTFDELQYGQRSELQQLAAELQVRVPQGLPIVVVAAGLPNIQDPRRIPTYFERGEWLHLGALDPAATRAALEEPARRAGRPLMPDASEALTAASGGYPYAIQLVGRYAWRESGNADTITLAHAERAVPRAEAELARGLFAPRWSGLTEQQRDYLRALAAISVAERSVVLPAEVARTLGKAPSHLSYMPARLERHGVVYVDVDGGLRFTMPGLADWVRTVHPYEHDPRAAGADVEAVGEQSTRDTDMSRRSAEHEGRQQPEPPDNGGHGLPR
jgi:hypothetical protein